MDSERLVTAFRLQIGGCRLFESPFYEGLVSRALDDWEAGGPVADLLADWEGDPLRGFLPLRVLGAVHERVLAGEAPALARFYPTAGGRADAEAAWPAFRALLADQADALRPRLANFPQTNEVRRCSGLLGCFLHVARRTGLPLRLREIGCSAGLNLPWSRYAYALGANRWGPADSPVSITAEWEGPPADFDAPAPVESRAGCDLDPRRIDDEADVRRLESFVWADQPNRLEQLRGAVDVARRDPPRIDRARAIEWLPAELAVPADGVCRVVFHSATWLYIPPDEQEDLRAAIEREGTRASDESPLAWLRHEDGERPGSIALHVTLWPGGKEEHLGMGHPHGRRVEWFGTS